MKNKKINLLFAVKGDFFKYACFGQLIEKDDESIVLVNNWSLPIKVSKSFNKYSIVDSLSGLMISSSNKRKECVEKYYKNKDRLKAERETAHYQDFINFKLKEIPEYKIEMEIEREEDDEIYD